MNGLMMNTPLLISSILRHADRNFPAREIVSVTADDPLTVTPTESASSARESSPTRWTSWACRSGDRVATLAWNDYRHLEAYYAIGGAGYVCHTINPRLFPEQIVSSSITRTISGS